MIYQLYQHQSDILDPLRWMARSSSAVFGHPWPGIGTGAVARRLSAALEVLSCMGTTHDRPDFGIRSVTVGHREVGVTEEVVRRTPFCSLVRFRKDIQVQEPRVLVVAPMSGHFATLLRGTVEAFLQDHDVYVTDWVNARQVPVLEGRFDFFDYIDHVRMMLAEIGGRPHVVGVCQPGPPVLAAGAIMAEDQDPNRPASMTFMGSPIDARLSPTATNQLAEEKPFTWFRSNMIHTVPWPYPGFGRRVYPGFVQLFSFMSMNEERHRDAHWDYFASLIDGDGDGVEKHEEFYDEYLSVLDLTEEFYLQTIDIVFQQHLLARGLLEHRGRKVDLAKITDIGLMTVEGEKDDISGVGQTQAAHGLCPHVPEDRRVLYVQPGVGHYGVFNGRRFRDEIYPRVRDFIASNEARSGVPQRSAAAA